MLQYSQNTSFSEQMHRNFLAKASGQTFQFCKLEVLEDMFIYSFTILDRALAQQLMPVRVSKHLYLYSICSDHTLVKNANILMICIYHNSPNKDLSNKHSHVAVQSKMSLNQLIFYNKHEKRVYFEVITSQICLICHIGLTNIQIEAIIPFSKKFEANP